MSRRAGAKLRRIISRNAADDAANSKPEKLLTNLHNSLKSSMARDSSNFSAHPSRIQVAVQVASKSLTRVIFLSPQKDEKDEKQHKSEGHF